MTERETSNKELTFADMLPDDRSPERIQCDAMREDIARFMRDDGDSWRGWQRLIKRLRGTSDADAAIFDLALRKELVESRDYLPPKAILGLIFTEMDWWNPKGGYAKRQTELAKLVDLFGIEHLKPAEEDEHNGQKTSSKKRKPESKKKKGLSFFWIIMGLIFLMILFD